MNDNWWTPDEAELDAVLSYRLGLRDLSEESQCWVVSRMSELGMTTATIADRMRCSQRQVKRLRAKVLTQQMRLVERYRLAMEHAERRRVDAVARVKALEAEVDSLEKRIMNKTGNPAVHQCLCHIG